MMENKDDKIEVIREGIQTIRDIMDETGFVDPEIEEALNTMDSLLTDLELPKMIPRMNLRELSLIIQAQDLLQSSLEDLKRHRRERGDKIYLKILNMKNVKAWYKERIKFDLQNISFRRKNWYRNLGRYKILKISEEMAKKIDIAFDREADKIIRNRICRSPGEVNHEEKQEEAKH